MKFTRTSFNSLMLAGLLATAGAGAMAQQQGTDAAPAALNPATPATASPHAKPHRGEHSMGSYDHAKMQAWMAKRQADMKARLQITPAQEGVWTAFVANMQPPARMMGGDKPMAAQRAELDKLTTPERIDKIKAMRTQRMTDMNAEMDKRGDATKAFYAGLSPDQQKIFDAEHRKMGEHQGRVPHGGGIHH